MIIAAFVENYKGKRTESRTIRAKSRNRHLIQTAPPLVRQYDLPSNKWGTVQYDPRKICHYPDTYETAIRAYQNGHPFSAEFFKDTPVLMSTGTHVRFAADRFLQKLGVSPEIIMETNDIETLFSLSECGMGVTFSYEKYAQKSLAINSANDGKYTALIFPVHDEALCGNIMINYRRDRYMTRAARHFIEIAQEVLRES